MITSLAKWWLQRQGHYIVQPGFVGILLGNQTAVCHKDGMHIFPNETHGEIIALNHSYVNIPENSFTKPSDGEKE
jgi:hypothetical protein